MKKISAVLQVGFIIVAACSILAITFVFLREITTNQGAIAKKALLDPSKLANVNSPGVEGGKDFFVPPLELQPLGYTKALVNHGYGWWYFPYTGAELEKARAWFTSFQTNMIYVGELSEIAAQSRSSRLLPTTTYDTDPSKGRFLCFDHK